MDAKDLRTEAALGERSSDVSSKYTHMGTALPCNVNKNYQEISSNPLAKVDTPTSRPCAVIGPDRILPPSTNTDAYLKKGHYEPWPPAENTFRQPPEYPHKTYQSPIRNISPRQTFQENMQRIMVAPTYNSVKMSEEANFGLDRNAPLGKSNKLSGSEPKYCDVPYTINHLSENQKNAEMCVSNVNSSRNCPPIWHPSGVNIRPTRPYGAPDLYQFSDYASCAGPRSMPITRPPHRSMNEESSYLHTEAYYHHGNVRFKPYPNVKERYPQARYEYVNNYPNPFHPPPPFPPHKYDMHKPVPHPSYPQVPIKFMENRINDAVIDGYQRPNQQVNYNAPYQNQMLHPAYGPVLPNSLQNKLYPYPPDKAVPANKLPYETNKIYLDYDNSRNKGFPENYYVNDISRSHMKSQVIMPNYTTINLPPHPYYRKENHSAKGFEYISHYRNVDPSIHTSHLARIASQFSPNGIAISPSDSSTSNDTAHTQANSLEDCGYVSQSSTASGRSNESGMHRILPNDVHRRYNYGYPSMVRTSPFTTKMQSNVNHSNSPKDKKGIDVRQFLQMWNEGDDENAGNPKETHVEFNHDSNKSMNQFEGKTQEQLYVLGLVNVPTEELSKYEHIQKVSKLPDNIKGYNNIELLKHFEEAIESSNLNIVNKTSTSRNFQSPRSSLAAGIAIPSRPLSPLDVEAKISQSVIHKEVGCNFEIRPCSPQMMNVEVAAPVQNILEERVIEKVSNPYQSPVVTNLANNGRNCNAPKQDHVKHVMLNESVKIPSCKLINTQCLNTDGVNVIRADYSLQDLESNSGVCLASLPRLDNDIELNFPEVNQQFINANKDSVITSKNPQRTPDVTYDNREININDDSSTTPTTKVIEKDFPKLSKYRKNKKLEAEPKEQISVKNSQFLRTDSVIIKNPENIRNFENASENSSYTTNPEKEQSDVIHLSPSMLHSYNVNNNVHTEKAENNDNEMAIDFSLHKSNFETESNISNEGNFKYSCTNNTLIENNILSNHNTADIYTNSTTLTTSNTSTEDNDTGLIDTNDSNITTVTYIKENVPARSMTQNLNSNNTAVTLTQNLNSNNTAVTLTQKNTPETNLCKSPLDNPIKNDEVNMMNDDDKDSRATGPGSDLCKSPSDSFIKNYEGNMMNDDDQDNRARGPETDFCKSPLDSPIKNYEVNMMYDDDIDIKDSRATGPESDLCKSPSDSSIKNDEGNMMNDDDKDSRARGPETDLCKSPLDSPIKNNEGNMINDDDKDSRAGGPETDLCKSPLDIPIKNYKDNMMNDDDKKSPVRGPETGLCKSPLDSPIKNDEGNIMNDEDKDSVTRGPESDFCKSPLDIPIKNYKGNMLNDDDKKSPVRGPDTDLCKSPLDSPIKNDEDNMKNDDDKDSRAGVSETDLSKSPLDIPIKNYEANMMNIDDKYSRANGPETDICKSPLDSPIKKDEGNMINNDDKYISGIIKDPSFDEKDFQQNLANQNETDKNKLAVKRLDADDSCIDDKDKNINDIIVSYPELKNENNDWHNLVSPANEQDEVTLETNDSNENYLKRSFSKVTDELYNVNSLGDSAYDSANLSCDVTSESLPNGCEIQRCNLKKMLFSPWIQKLILQSNEIEFKTKLGEEKNITKMPINHGSSQMESDSYINKKALLDTVISYSKEALSAYDLDSNITNIPNNASLNIAEKCILFTADCCLSEDKKKEYFTEQIPIKNSVALSNNVCSPENKNIKQKKSILSSDIPNYTSEYALGEDCGNEENDLLQKQPNRSPAVYTENLNISCEVNKEELNKENPDLTKLYQKNQSINVIQNLDEGYEEKVKMNIDTSDLTEMFKEGSETLSSKKGEAEKCTKSTFSLQSEVPNIPKITCVEYYAENETIPDFREQSLADSRFLLSRELKKEISKDSGDESKKEIDNVLFPTREIQDNKILNNKIVAENLDGLDKQKNECFVNLTKTNDASLCGENCSKEDKTKKLFAENNEVSESYNISKDIVTNVSSNVINEDEVDNRTFSILNENNDEPELYNMPKILSQECHENIQDDSETIVITDNQSSPTVLNNVCLIQNSNNEIKLVRENSIEKRRSILKRSLSDSALDTINSDSLEEFGNRPSRKRRKNNEVLKICDPQFVTESLCNFQNNRRNSISSAYEDNLSFCIVIDDECILTQENEDKICFAAVSEENLIGTQETHFTETDVAAPSEMLMSTQTDMCELSEPFVLEISDANTFEESWVDDIGCVETVVSDDVAEDMIISAPSTPHNGTVFDDNTSDIFNVSYEHTDKVKHIYGGKMCNDDAEFVETLYRTPQMNVNRTLSNRESHMSDDYEELDENIIIKSTDYESHIEHSIKAELEDTSVPANHIYEGDKKADACLQKSAEPFEDIVTKVDNYTPEVVKTQDDTVNSCESSIDNVFMYNQGSDSLNYETQSSPEVSSTTSEERSSSILLKITNYKGMRTSQLNESNVEYNSSNCCKFTENISYTSINNSSKPRPLITKGAQKYIPPIIEPLGDLKVKLPLSQQSLLKLKQLKISKSLPKHSDYKKNDVTKKPKPRFEDVLKSIDEIQFKMHKEKSRKPKKSVPKVVIKKTESGSHYASMPDKRYFNPDLTGRKWQPWVFIEKDSFIDKMAIKNKTKAIFNHRKNTYVLSDKFQKYKAAPSAKFIMSQPKVDDSSMGHLKYTIRLKHTY